MIKFPKFPGKTQAGGPACREASFLRHEGGNFALIFAIFGTAAAIMFGVAISFAGLISARDQLDSNADAAVLGAVSRSVIKPGADTATQIAASTTVAQNLFAGGTLPPNTVVAAPTINVTVNSGVYVATLSYKAQYTLPFGAILGINTLPVSATVSATSSAAGNSAPRYVDIFVLVDASASMGIGATMNDITLMNSTKGMDGGSGGCSVACHAIGTDTTAHNAGATLRFDVVRNAVEQITQSAQNLNASGPLVIRMGLYSFATGFTTLQDLTSDIPEVYSAAQAMTLQGYDAGTNAATALQALKNKITSDDPVIGNGSSASSPQVFAILATDAISNSTDNQSASTWVSSPTFVPFNPNAVPDPNNNGVMDLEGLDPGQCGPLKSAGINMMTLETAYLINPADLVSGTPGYLRYNYINTTLAGSTASNMKACASNPSYALSASAPQDIVNDLQQLFNTATQSAPRLTQ
ncbi:MAG: VWA domain-containing protein [Hyphomicrobiales bacterium]|nr:VWA domain-containing protein [Hyphomicrobiales bacterium]